MANIPASFDSIKYYLEKYAPDLRADATDKTSVISEESSVTLRGYYITAINFVLKYIVLSDVRPVNDEIIVDTQSSIENSQFVNEDINFDPDFFANEYNIALAGGSYFNLTFTRHESSNAFYWDEFPIDKEGASETDKNSLREALAAMQEKIDQGRVVETANYIWSIQANKEDLINWGANYGVELPKKQTFAFGHNAQALQNNSFAAGEDALAQGVNAAAFGRATIANKGAFAAGYGNIAEGDYSAALGGQNIAKGTASMAVGNHTRANGDFSLASGRSSIAEGHSAHVEGWSTVTGNAEFGGTLNTDTTDGYFAHAEGNHTRARGNSSHAEGRNSEAAAIASHAEGWQTLASGARSHSEGSGTKSQGFAAHAEGHQTIASGQGAHAEGARYVDDKNNEYYTTASAEGAHAEGQATTASGAASHSEGYRTIASGTYSHAEGSVNTVSAYAGHAEGSNNIVEGTRAHAEGRGNKAIGEYSHAEGNSTEANGDRSHAEGSQTKANGFASHASGKGTIASGIGQMVTGNYNKENSNALFIVGDGTGPEEENRSNAFEITQNTVIAHGKDIMSGLVECVGSATVTVGYNESKQLYYFGEFSTSDRNYPFSTSIEEGTNLSWLENADFILIKSKTSYGGYPSIFEIYCPLFMLKAVSHFSFDYNAEISDEEKMRFCFIAHVPGGQMGSSSELLYIGKEFQELLYTENGSRYSNITLIGYKLPF